MALNSMTGFARADGVFAPWNWVWEARSVNGRGLEIRLRLPPGLDGLDMPVRVLAQKHFKRGNIQLSLQLERSNAGADLSVNRDALHLVMGAVRELMREPGFAAPDPAAVLALRGVLESNEPALSAETLEVRESALIAGAEHAVLELKVSRAYEGAALGKLLLEMFGKLEELVAHAQAHAAIQPERARARLQEQIKFLLDQRTGVAEDRLAQELALLAVKGDVREELDRLRIHIRGGQELLGAADAVGRKFDFLTQELNREANTLCAKSGDAGLTAIGLELKAAIDQLREQVQNVE